MSIFWMDLVRLTFHLRSLLELLYLDLEGGLLLIQLLHLLARVNKTSQHQVDRHLHMKEYNAARERNSIVPYREMRPSRTR